jgi:hypothetical protein
MSTPAQIAANQQNAQYSTGPTSDAGKQAVSQNARTHGLSGAFAILPGENLDEYIDLLNGLLAEHAPTSETEKVLVQRMAQHIWISQRAINLQQLCLDPETGICDSEYRLALYLRYQTTHDRAFHKCLSELLKLRADKRKAANGFVSQKPSAVPNGTAQQTNISDAATGPKATGPSPVGFVSQNVPAVQNHASQQPQSSNQNGTSAEARGFALNGFVSQNDAPSPESTYPHRKEAA